MSTPYYSDDLVTLYYGDCREVTEWLAADVLVTDPPYGVAYKSGRRRDAVAIIGDTNLNARDEALRLWGARPALVFGCWKQPRPANVRQLVVWDKRGGNGYSGDLKMPWAEVTEEVYVLGGGWVGRRRPNIIAAPSLPAAASYRPDHPTPKPVQLMSALLECCPAGTIADPFAGSGATLVAAKLAGRRAVGVELEERYCAMTAERLAQDALPLAVGG